MVSVVLSVRVLVMGIFSVARWRCGGGLTVCFFVRVKAAICALPFHAVAAAATAFGAPFFSWGGCAVGCRHGRATSGYLHIMHIIGFFLIALVCWQKRL